MFGEQSAAEASASACRLEASQLPRRNYILKDQYALAKSHRRAEPSELQPHVLCPFLTGEAFHLVIAPDVLH